MVELRLLVLMMLLGWSTLCCVSPPPGRSPAVAAPLLAMASAGQRLPDATSARIYVAIPVRTAGATTSHPMLGFTRDNWSTSVRQQGRVQVYIAETPDFYEVIEQELPRTVRGFGTLDAAIADANRRYPDWPLVTFDP